MKYAILFQGQGQYSLSYVRNLYKKSKIVQGIFERANQILDSSLSQVLMKIDDVENLDTDYAQVMILVMEYACYQFFVNDFKEQPSFLAGHSLGEITALTVAGVISFEDAVKLVSFRGRLMKNGRGEESEGMLAVRDVSYENLVSMCREVEMNTKQCIVCANYNSTNQIILSGHREALMILKNKLPSKSSKFLAVNRAFHSPLMQGIVNEFNEYIKQIEFNEIKIPVVSSVTALPYIASWSIAGILTSQLTSSVVWKNVMEYLENQGVSYFAQITDSRLFQTIDKSLDRNHIWLKPEQLCNGEIYDFNSLYPKSSSNESSHGLIIGEILTHMIAYPWEEGVSKEDIFYAQNNYNRIKECFIHCQDDKKEFSEKEITEFFIILRKVLENKNLQNEKVDTIIYRILNKYGLKGIKLK